jgi:hypothetical protein
MGGCECEGPLLWRLTEKVIVQQVIDEYGIDSDTLQKYEKKLFEMMDVAPVGAEEVVTLIEELFDHG